MKRKLILPAAAVAITAATIYGAKQIDAMGFGPNHETMVQRFAEAFGKSEVEVEAVFSTMHEAMQAERDNAFIARLDEAVAAGELTGEQKAVILAKHEELMAQHEADFENRQSMNREQWREQREAQRTELESWAETNGVDLGYLMPRRGPNGYGDGDGEGMGGHMGGKMGGW